MLSTGAASQFFNKTDAELSLRRGVQLYTSGEFSSLELADALRAGLDGLQAQLDLQTAYLTANLQAAACDRARYLGVNDYEAIFRRTLYRGDCGLGFHRLRRTANPRKLTPPWVKKKRRRINTRMKKRSPALTKASMAKPNPLTKVKRRTNLFLFLRKCRRDFEHKNRSGSEAGDP